MEFMLMNVIGVVFGYIYGIKLLIFIIRGIYTSSLILKGQLVGIELGLRG
jgi:hypothetical protein